ncbi:ABC transporter ATP-binding protein [Poseidonocella sp. HB161398]|uniref:ABC transporter ATP-binding protein n=1 Tax=Poseidonocella sp. HB161398 TaxID=2320855 RepID=UPI0019800715|nr:ABC transporter ATP-binding protein [Poseidonocella sp. HB161398]
MRDGLTARGLTLGYEGRTICRDLDLALPKGEVTVIVGPNGCGKSTLLRGLCRLIAPAAGEVRLEGEDIHRMPTRLLAQRLAMLPQSSTAPPGITVADLVARGRHPHRRAFGGWSAADAEAVAHALDATGVAEMAESAVDTLSGGQRQRVWVAMALAQDTGWLLLDEPTTYLDIAHQIDLLDLFAALNRERGVSIVAVLHDLNLACRYADRLVVMAEGRIVAEGPPARVLTAELVDQVFGLPCLIVPDPVTGTPMMVPRGRHPARAAAE